MTALSSSQPLVPGLISRRSPAIYEFDQARSRGLRRRIWNTLTGRPGLLLTLNEATKGRTLAGQSDAGVEIVPIDQIHGTVDRGGDFGFDFDPLGFHNQERWTNIAQAWLNGAEFPAVSLVKVGASYFVEDGHHRISVANHFGQKEIDARVTVLHLSAEPARTRPAARSATRWAERIAGWLPRWPVQMPGSASPSPVACRTSGHQCQCV